MVLEYLNGSYEPFLIYIYSRQCDFMQKLLKSLKSWKSPNCSSQLSMVHGLSNSIFPCLSVHPSRYGNIFSFSSSSFFLSHSFWDESNAKLPNCQDVKAFWALQGFNFEICPKFAQDMSKICSRYAQVLSKVWGFKLTKWGKMSPGSVHPLGNYVAGDVRDAVGHFVAGTKCLLTGGGKKKLPKNFFSGNGLKWRKIGQITFCHPAPLPPLEGGPGGPNIQMLDFPLSSWDEHSCTFV